MPRAQDFFKSIPQSTREKSRKHLDQFLISKRLLQDGPVAVTVSHIGTAVSGRVDERYAACGECLRHGRVSVTIQVHIQHSEVDDLRVNRGKRLLDRGSSDHGLASEIGQHVFNHHENQQLVLDNQDPPTSQQLIDHEHLMAWEKSSCRSDRPTDSRDALYLRVHGRYRARSPGSRTLYALVA